LAESWYEIAGGNSKSKIGSTGKACAIYKVHCNQCALQIENLFSCSSMVEPATDLY